MDIFSSKIVLNLSGKKNFTTPCGSVMTLIAITTSLLIIIFYSSSQLSKDNPIVIESSYYDSSSVYSALSTNQTNLDIAFAIYDYENKLYVDATNLFNIEVQIGGNVNSQVSITPCTDMTPFKTQYGNHNGNIFCLQEKNSKYISDPSFQFNIKVSPCKNTTTQTCSSFEYIESQVSSYRLILFYKEHSLNIQDYSNPYSELISSIEFVLWPGIGKYASFKLQMTEIKTDSGLVTSKYDKEIKYALANFYVDSMLFSSNQNNYVWISIKNSGKVNQINRKYTKIQDLIPFYVSIFWILYSTFRLLAGPFSQFILYEKLARNLVNFSTLLNRNKDNALQNNLTKSQTSKVHVSPKITIPDQNLDVSIVGNNQFETLCKENNQVSMSINASHLEESINDLYTENPLKVPSEISMIKKKIPAVPKIDLSKLHQKASSCWKKGSISKKETSFLEWIKSFCCKNNPKIEFIKKISSALNKKLDVVYQLRKFEEIEYLKDFLLNDEQRSLFEMSINAKFNEKIDNILKNTNIAQENLLSLQEKLQLVDELCMNLETHEVRSDIDNYCLKF